MLSLDVNLKLGCQAESEGSFLQYPILAPRRAAFVFRPSESDKGNRFAACHQFHRRFLYTNLVTQAFASETRSSGQGGAGVQVSPSSGRHFMYKLLLWCHEFGIFIHPSVKLLRSPSVYRDFCFEVCGEAIGKYEPVIAVPEHLLIGFKDAEVDEPQIEFRKEEPNGTSDEDICNFFFTSLGLLVSDLLVATNSELTDPRHVFAEALSRTRTMQNAPYMDSVQIDEGETGLADAFLQMVHNYVNAGPLTGRVSRPELCWAVSVSLSHSTPLVIGTKFPSFGLIPLVHLFPHGGAGTNAIPLAHRGPVSMQKILEFMRRHFGLHLSAAAPCVFVLPTRLLSDGEEIRMQAMSPICCKDDSMDSVAKMWILACGSPPRSSLPTATLASWQKEAFSHICGGPP